MFTADDHRFMARALQLAERGRFSTQPNPRVGCVVVRDGVIVGEGFHAHAGEGHAEVNALKQASDLAKGATAYVTLEPCSHQGRTPPCAAALIEAGVARVVAAMVDPNPKVSGKGLTLLNKASVETASGLMETEAKALNPGFIMRMAQQRPFVRLKLAGSLDGRTAMADGDSVWITGEAARNDVQRLRAQSGAVVTGVATVLADDPSLNVRFNPSDPYENISAQPLRVILDSQLRTPVTAKILQLEGRVLIFANRSVEPKASAPAHAPRLPPVSVRIQALQEQGAEVVLVDGSEQGLGLLQVLAELAKREINECHLECGAKLAASFIEQGLVDEMVYYMAPCLMGSDAKSLIDLPIKAMAEKRVMRIGQIDRIGEDIRMVLKFD